MQLAGRLRTTTLGDVLGALYRARAHGVLELSETIGPSAGQRHRIFLSGGQVTRVDATEADAPIGSSLRGHLLDALDALFRLPDATLRFHVARPTTRGGDPLPPRDYLAGRPRARDRGETRASGELPMRQRAYETLGLRRGATRGEVVRAFQRLAREVHPDRFPEASDAERRALVARFSALSVAYHALVG